MTGAAQTGRLAVRSILRHLAARKRSIIDIDRIPSLDLMSAGHFPLALAAPWQHVLTRLVLRKAVSINTTAADTMPA